MVVVGMWLAVGLLAASPLLHELLHQDSQNNQHHCLVSQLGKSSLCGGWADASPIPSPEYLDFPDSSEYHFLPTSDNRLSPSRAPPSLFISIKVGG